MKIRLHGTEDECRQAAGRLHAVGEILAISGSYPDRGTSRLVRIYAEIRLSQPPRPADDERLRPALPGETHD